MTLIQQQLQEHYAAMPGPRQEAADWRAVGKLYGISGSTAKKIANGSREPSKLLQILAEAYEIMTDQQTIMLVARAWVIGEENDRVLDAVRQNNRAAGQGEVGSGPEDQGSVGLPDVQAEEG